MFLCTCTILSKIILKKARRGCATVSGFYKHLDFFYLFKKISQDSMEYTINMITDIIILLSVVRV